MLSIQHPELCKAVIDFPAGLRGFRIPGEGLPRLLLKLPTSFLLAAQLVRGFKVYVAPVNVREAATIGLMCAFFDDPECPLTLWTLLADEPATHDIVSVLRPQYIIVHMFDEHDREMLGYHAYVDVPLMAKIRLEHAKLLSLDHDSFHEASEAGADWFSRRSDDDDLAAISIKFGEPLFPEDLHILDLRPDQYRFHGAKGFGSTVLVRPEPGPYQEVDIILQLQKIFAPDTIYHGPRRVYDGEEIADVIVITDETCLIVQAKDSPNTKDSLDNDLDRKRRKSIKQLNKGAQQASGAINYLERMQPLRMLIDDAEVEIDLGSRQILSLIVVRELFLDGYDDYSDVLFKLFEKTLFPCIALDYQELHSYATYCEGEQGFVGAYFEVFDYAQANGKFPRLRFGLNDVHSR